MDQPCLAEPLRILQLNMLYTSEHLQLTDDRLIDPLGTVRLQDLPDPQPQHPARLTNATPLAERLWRIALDDIEKNIIETDTGLYFGAGREFGMTVYTRDIALSGVLGLDRLYPDVMKSSLLHTREVRSETGFKLSKGYSLPEIPIEWEEEDLTEKGYQKRYHTNNYLRRTDDVVWLWAAEDLASASGKREDWKWVYEWGDRFFRDFYMPFFDETDGLFRGQACFVDIHFTEFKATGYPRDWSISDCIMGKALSTNCLFYQGMLAMSRAAGETNKPFEKVEWSAKAENLRRSIIREFRRDDGSFAYYKDRSNRLLPMRHCLGEGLAVLHEVVRGEEAKRALVNYSVSPFGVPLFDPFFKEDDYYHNNSSWPFCDTFYIRASEKADGGDRTALNAALLARVCRDESGFRELVDYRTGEPKGSAHQLWTAAAFVDVCLRSNLTISNI